MTNMPTESVLEWAANAVGASAKVLTVEGLHDGSSPWWLRIDDGRTIHEVILRVAGWIPPQMIASGAAALRLAEDRGLAAPRLIATDLDGRVSGAPATLETALPGRSESPRQASVERLREAGAAIARVHVVRLAPTDDLPLKVRPISGDDHAMERRWANLYRACEADERPAVVQALSELTGWPAPHAQRTLEATGSSPLLQLADDRVRGMDRPAVATVFVHGDVHPGNMRWDGDTCLALIDWKDAGAGDPGVDLGQLRMQMAIRYGPDAAEHVLEGWQAHAGRQATNVAYWDAVAALNTPAVLGGLRTPRERAAATQRRDQFLRTALDRLDPPTRVPRASRYA